MFIMVVYENKTPSFVYPFANVLSYPIIVYKFQAFCYFCMS